MRSIAAATCMGFGVRCDQQVTYLLHVDLQEAYGDPEDRLVRVLFDVVENVGDGARHNAELVLRCCGRLGHLPLVELDLRCGLQLLFVEVSLAPKDRVRLAGASLAVRHDHPVEAVENIVDDRSRYLGERHVLARLHLEHAVKSEIALVKTRPHK